jgi:hypothetical protein
LAALDTELTWTVIRGRYMVEIQIKHWSYPVLGIEDEFGGMARVTVTVVAVVGTVMFRIATLCTVNISMIIKEC